MQTVDRDDESTTAREEVSMHEQFEFRSKVFNSTEPRDYFINPSCYGDDVCRWVGRELRKRGFIAAEEPGQEDWGWYLPFEVDGAKHLFLVGFQAGEPDENGRWLVFLERRGVLRTLRGRRSEDVLPTAVDAIRVVLASSPDIQLWSASDDDEEDEA